jgi:hypothetical protein
MMDDQTKLRGNLTLTKDEDCVEVDIQAREFVAGAMIRKACGVGKLIVDHLVSKEIIRNTLVWWWKPASNLFFKALGENLFLIEFLDKWDKECLLGGRPWVFEGSLFLIEDFDGLA